MGEMFEGDSAEGLACTDPGARTPIGTSRNFPAHMSAESPSNISPKSYPKFRNPRTTFEIFKKTTLKNLKAPIGVLARLTLRSVPHHHRHGFGAKFFDTFSNQSSRNLNHFLFHTKKSPLQKNSASNLIFSPHFICFEESCFSSKYVQINLLLLQMLYLKDQERPME